MEDVVLHYKTADAVQLSSLIWRTETALESFPCRVLPTFTPWFPSTSDRLLPIRPSKPAPPAHAVTQKTKEDNRTLQYSKHLTSTEGSGDSTSNSVPARFKSDAKADTTAHPECNYKQDIESLIIVNRPHETNHLHKPTYAVVTTDARPDNQPALSCSNVTQSTGPPHGKLGKSTSYIPKPPPHTPLPPLVPAGQTRPPDNTSPDTARLSPEKRTPRHRVSEDGGVQRSWSVVAHSGLPPRTAPSLSERFHETVTGHGLHLRQRARWLIGQHNWVPSGDMEQVWRKLNRSIKSSSLPTCNANIQREQRQIWVFCDVLYSEHVGKYLKEELALSGQITLFVSKLGNILTL